MRQGSFTLDNLMNYVYGEQISKIPAKMYNDDAQVKYLDFGSLYTYCCHGSKEHQIRRWLRERIAYVDSMLGYFTSQEDQVTIRMNKDGKVSFEVTPYIPLYFSVKWSNATGGTQTFKLKRGETKTFTYSSTTSTDQEVIIYHAKYIKRLDNLSNLNPSSCILSNAVKLTNVEIHSSELYNINVTNNKFLRSINLENCTALGTVTATGSSLNLSNCKYLRYCNVYNTHLTEVQLNTSGGSLTEIYYPKSIQSINLVKQRLLELIGLPYGEGGKEIPTSLYTISIQECPSITKLNTSSDPTIASSFASMVYVNNLTIRNSLDLASLKFDGFHRLQNVTIENMYNLEEVGFNNLLPVGETSTIKYIGMSNCPKLGTIELNCTSNDYEITFADDAILNFGGLFKLNSITSNCVLKGIKTIVVPINLESMFFTNEYGSGYSTIENIWVSSQCNVDTQATTPIVTHVDSTYRGIDFLGMNLKNIDLGALVNIPKAINFKLSPTTVNPHFNLNRDGETYKYLQPVGTLDLSNYTESLAKFFDGVDLDKLEIICNNNLPQTDLSYCFYNSSFSTNDAINKLLTKVSSITNLDYCFYRTTINSVDILGDINMGESSSMNYTFAECPNIKELNSVVIPSNVTSVEGMFNKCPLTVINNMVVNVRGSISGLFKGCNKLTTINTLRIPNVTDVSNTFDGCTSLSSLSGFELPSSCTNVSNLFNGCYMLTELGMEFGANITAGDNWYPPNLEALHDTTISNDYVKLTNCTTLKTLNGVNISGGDLSDLFSGCTNLVNINSCTFNATKSLARAFKGCSKITINPITTIVNTVTDISEMYSGCTGITDISGMTFGRGITNATDWCPPGLTTANNVTIKNNIVKFIDCTSLTTCTNLDVSNISNIDRFFSGCSSLTSDVVIPSNITSCVETFKNCTSMTNIHANWNNTYTDGITSTDCYTGCTGIEQIDGESVVLYPGDNSLDYIPNEWGGYGLVGDYVSVFEINIPSDNYTITPLFYSYAFTYRTDNEVYRSEKNAIAWGDGNHYGSSDILNDPNYDSTYGGIHGNNTGPSHTYAKAGTYYLKGTFYSGGYKYRGNIASCIVKCLKLASKYYQESPKDITSLSNEFSGCSNLTYVDLSSYKNNNLTILSQLFTNCTSLTLDNIVGLNNLNLSNITHMTGMFSGCTKITQLPFTTIPDNVTGIDSIFKNTGITDISGLTVGSGVTSATDWITGSPITTANNVTMKNNNTKFTGNSTLVSCTNFKITSDVTRLSQIFQNCSNLASFSFSDESNFSNLTSMAEIFDTCSRLTIINLSNVVCTNKLTSINKLCHNCGSLTTLYLPSNLQDSSITVIRRIATDCKKLKTLYNLYLPDGFIEFDDYSLGWVGTIEPKNAIDVIGFRVPNTTTPATVFAKVSKMFKTFSNVIWPETTTSIASMFKDLIHLTQDLEIPSHITNCTNAFKGCTSMTHVHSNWNNTYDNEITSTDCYAGCTGITHVDGVNVITYEGKEGLDEVPESWGGYGFNKETTCVLEVLTTQSNYRVDLTYTMQNTTDYTTSWGDGTVDTLYYHTYTSPGKYIIKTKYPNIFTIGSAANISYVLTKALQMRKTLDYNRFCFRGCYNLTYLNIDNCEIVSNTLLYENERLAYISANNLKFISPSSNSASPFVSGKGYGYGADVTEVQIIGVETWDVSECINFSSMFKGAKITSLDLSNWDTSKAASMNQLFNGCTSLTSVNMSGWQFNNDCSISSMFNSTSNLKTIIGHENWDLSNVKDCGLLFYNSGIEELNVTNWNMSGKGSTNGVFQNSKLSNLIGSENLINSTWSSLPSIFNGCTSLTTLDVSNWDISNVTEMTSLFCNCTNLQTIKGLENWNTSSVYSIVDMFKNCKALSDFPNIQNWNLSNCAQFDGLFYGAGCGGTFRPNWNLANIGNGYSYGINGMFRDLKSTETTIIDLSNCTIPKNNPVVKSTGYLFGDSSYITEIKLPNNLKVGSIASWFRGCSRLSSVDMSNLDLSECTDMNSTFYFCSSLTSVLVDNTLDTSKVTNMINMLSNCTSLNSFDFLLKFNTSSVTNMKGLVDNTPISDTALASVIATWDFSKVQSMEGMLKNCKNITTIDFTGKDLNSVTNISLISDSIPNLETFIFPLDNNNVITDWQSIFSSAINLKTVKTFNLDRFSLGSNFSRWACAYANGYGNFKYDIDITFGGTLSKEGAQCFFDTFTYIGSARGILNKISAASWERMFRNNLHDYSGTSTSATLQLSDIVLAKLTPTQIAIATNKGWTLQGGAST